MPENNNDISKEIVNSIDRLTRTMMEGFAAQQRNTGVSLEESARHAYENMEDRMDSLLTKYENAKRGGGNKEYINQLARAIKSLKDDTQDAKFKLEYIDLARKIAKLEQELNTEESKSDNDKDSQKIVGLREAINKFTAQQQELANNQKNYFRDDSERLLETNNFLTNGVTGYEEALEQICESDREHLQALRNIEKAQATYTARVEESKQQWGLVKEAAMSVFGLIAKGANYWMKYNAQAISDAKRLGMTSKEEAMGYMETLMENSKTLSRNFGMTAEQAMKMQDVYTKVTGRAALLTQSQMEDIAASSKLMGEETVQSAIKIMDTMGTTSQSTTEFLDRNFARAVNSGLDTVKASEEFVKNLSLANKLSFRNGVDGISKMTILSQKIKMNLQEVANVADKFSTIEGAIENSAKLQMLGGPMAMLGGNPMQMLYESLSDPEALFERMKDMASTQAVFNRRTGEAEIDPMTLQFMKEQEKILGVSPGTLIGSAKQQAKINAIEGDFRRFSPAVYAKTNEEQRAAIVNKAEYDKELGTWVVKYLDQQGKEQKADIKNITEYQIQEITKDNIEPVEDIRKNVRKIAMELIGTQERITSMKDQFFTGVGQMLSAPMKGIDSLLTGINQSGLWQTLTSGSFMPLTLGGYGLYRYGKAKGKMWATKAFNREFINKGGQLNKNFKNSQSTPFENKTEPMRDAGLKGRGGGRGLTRWNPRGWSGLSKAAKATTVGMAAVNGIITMYHGITQANNEKAREDEMINRARSYYTDPNMAQNRNFTFTETELKQRQLGAINRQRRNVAGSVGEGIGETGGAILGAAVGSFLGPAGMIVGGLIGSWLGGKGGKKMGRSFAGHETMDTIGEHLHAIEGSDEEENIRRIVLPIESIDYNVALIARMMGSTTAIPARGNIYLDAEAAGEINTEVATVEPQILQNENVNPMDSYSVGGSVYHPTGPLTLNVQGSIDLNLKGVTIGSFSEKDIVDIILNSLPMRKALTAGVCNEIARNGQGAGSPTNDDTGFRLQTGKNTTYNTGMGTSTT